MNTSRLIKILAILAVTSLVAGCKLAVMVNEGGSVQSSSGAHNCAEGTLCTIKITDVNFSESFTAVARPGYQFVKWNTGGGFLCPNSTSPTCTVVLSGDATAMATVASFSTGYVMPVFKDVGFDFDGDGIRNELDDDIDGDGIRNEDDTCPADPGPQCTIDSLYINGKEWAQPILFRGTSRNAVNAVCPEGICNGILAGSFTHEGAPVVWGHDLTGWTWATPEDLNDLRLYYTGPTYIFGCQEGERFATDGWRPWTFISLLTMKGVVGITYSSEQGGYETFVSTDPAGPLGCGWRVGNSDGTPGTQPTGAWFYRTP